ncbi:hypothetical protein QZH41_003664 [Actinostola sp. cb2023]|nr:hypothetical protein QZH41_003664 [Actinostola sp. cb2023]
MIADMKRPVNGQDNRINLDKRVKRRYDRNNTWNDQQTGTTDRNNTWNDQQTGRTDRNNTWNDQQTGRTDRNNTWNDQQTGRTDRNNTWNDQQTGGTDRNNQERPANRRNRPQQPRTTSKQAERPQKSKTASKQAQPTATIPGTTSKQAEPTATIPGTTSKQAEPTATIKYEDNQMNVIEGLRNTSKGQLQYDLHWIPSEQKLDQCSRSPSISCQFSRVLQGLQGPSFLGETKEDNNSQTKSNSGEDKRLDCTTNSINTLGPEYYDTTHVNLYRYDEEKKEQAKQRIEERRSCFKTHSDKLQEEKSRILHQQFEERRDKYLELLQNMKQDLRNYELQAAIKQKALVLQHEKSAARASRKVQHVVELKRKIAEEEERHKKELSILLKWHQDTIVIYKELDATIRNCNFQDHLQPKITTIMEEAKKVLNLSVNTLSDSRSVGKAVEGALQHLPEYCKIMKMLLDNARQAVSDAEYKVKKEMAEKEAKKREEEAKRKQEEEAKKREAQLKAASVTEYLSSSISSSSVQEYSKLYCRNLLALKIVQQGSQQVSSNHNAAFPLASVVIGIWCAFPDVGELVLGHFYSQCPFLVPMYMPQPEGMSDKDYFKSLGYLCEDGEIEPRDKYLKRISGTIRLYAAIVSSVPPRGSSTNHPHGITYGWMWLARILNLPPKPDYTATALFEFLDITGHALQKQYRSQFWKLILVIVRELIPKIRQITAPSQSGPIVRLESFLEKAFQSRSFQRPSGYLDANWWNSAGFSGIYGH